MFFVIRASKHALQMMQLAGRKIIQFPILLILIGACIIILSSFLTLFFLIQHLYFGLNVMDFNTILNYIGFPVTTHVLQTLFCLISLMAAMLILVVFSYSATYLLLCKGLNKKSSAGAFWKILKKSFSELVRHAIIATSGSLAWLFSALYIDERFNDLQDMCDGTYTPNYGKYDDPFNILIYPLLVIKPGVNLPALRDESVATMRKSFAKEAECQFTFSYLSYFVMFLVILGGYMLWKYKFASLEIAFILGLVTFVIYWSIIRLIMIVFAVSVYHYCTGKDSLMYPKLFIEKTYR